MKNQVPKKILSKKEDELVTVLGVVGTALALTCFIQHFYAMTEVWVAWVLFVIYTFLVIAYLLLAVKKTIAPLLIIIATSLLFIDQAFLIATQVFSPIITITLLFSLVVIVLLYMDDIPAKIKAKNLEQKQDEDFWRDKL